MTAGRLSIAAQTVKETVSAVDVGRTLGWEIRRGRCQCPAHGGKDYNCVLYGGSRGWYCHVCHQGGDVIRLVQQALGFGFKDAIVWINSEFHLGLDLDSPMTADAQRTAERAREMREAILAMREANARDRLETALDLSRVLDALEDQRDAHLPKTAEEDWDSAFCEAVRWIPEVRRMAEDAMFDCVKKTDG